MFVIQNKQTNLDLRISISNGSFYEIKKRKEKIKKLIKFDETKSC